LHGELDGLESLFDRSLAFSVVRGGEEVNVGGRMHHPDGEGTKIVDAADLDLAGFQGSLDSLDEAETDPVAQFRVFETHPVDFVQHRAAVGIA
jgi:hypothetical protein